MNILLILFSVGPFRFKQKWQRETMLTMEHPRFVHRFEFHGEWQFGFF